MFQDFRQFAEANNNVLVGSTAFLGVAERMCEIGLRKAVEALCYN